MPEERQISDTESRPLAPQRLEAGPPGRFWRLAGPLALACVLLLWTLGLFATPPPRLLSSLLGTISILGLFYTAEALISRTWRRRPVQVLAGGLLPPFAALLFTGSTLLGPEPEIRNRPAELEGQTPKTLQILDLNVLHGYPTLRGQEERYERLRASLQELYPDLLLLQEVWSTTAHGHLAHRLADDLGMNVAYARANGSRRLIGFEEGLAVLSRFPIRRAWREELSPRRILLERRIVLFAELDIPGRGPTTVGVVHLTHRDPEVRDRQARDLASRLPSEELLLLAGDFNGRSESEAVSLFGEAGFVDLLPGGIDHVLLKEERLQDVAVVRWALDEEEVYRLTGDRGPISDHLGILVELGLDSR